MIIPDIETVIFPESGGTVVMQVVYDNTAQSAISPPYVGLPWIEIDDIGGRPLDTGFEVRYEITCQVNTSETRYNAIYFRCVSRQGEIVNKELSVTQDTGEHQYAPIWKDTTYSTYYPNVIDYAIGKNNIAFFFGRSYLGPERDGTYIPIARVCESHLRSELPDFREMEDEVIADENAVGDFKLYDTNGTILYNYRFLNAWAGDWNGEDMVLTNAVNGHLDPRMKLFFTEYNNEEKDEEYDIQSDL